MKRAIEFYSEGFKLCGDVYVPDGLAAGETRSAILLCHGYTGVKDLYLPDNARVLNEAGLRMGLIDLDALAGWILEDGLPVRFQVQVHKLIWGADAKGV